MGIGNTGPQGPQGPLSGVTSVTDNVTYYPLIVTGVGSVSPYVSVASSYFSFNPSSGTLVVNQMNVAGVVTATSFVGNGSGLTGAGSTVADDTTTNATFFPVFTQTTTGTITASKVSTTKLTFNPSTGALTATDINSSSDISLKENVKSIDNSLEKVLQLNGVEFNWKDTNQPSLGVIAQEVENVLPQLVRETNGIKAVNYNGLIGVLIEAVKEQQKQINTLKKEIEELK